MLSKLLQFSRQLRQSSDCSGAQLQVLSDLHLEVGQQYTTFTFPATAPYLVLAGDIGRLIDYTSYLAFLASLIPRYERIFLVLGNHEFYGLGYPSGIQAAQKLPHEAALEGKVTLLHKVRWDDPESHLTLLGCTLWSSIPAHAADIVQSKVNDFKKIHGWSVQQHNQLHEEELSWLRQQVESMTTEGHSSRTLVVATHHAPCLQGTSSPQNTANAWTPAFATEILSRDDSWKRVKTWIFGHTHYSNDFVRNGIRLVSNQRGYVLPGASQGEGEGGGSREGTRHEFDPSMSITA